VLKILKKDLIGGRIVTIYTGVTTVKERPLKTGNPEDDDGSTNDSQANVF
jgi:hypothetical protein